MVCGLSDELPALMYVRGRPYHLLWSTKCVHINSKSCISTGIARVWAWHHTLSLLCEGDSPPVRLQHDRSLSNRSFIREEEFRQKWHCMHWHPYSHDPTNLYDFIKCPVAKAMFVSTVQQYRTLTRTQTIVSMLKPTLFYPLPCCWYSMCSLPRRGRGLGRLPVRTRACAYRICMYLLCHVIRIHGHSYVRSYRSYSRAESLSLLDIKVQ